MSDVFSSADVSPCGLYRYHLARRWGPGPTALFIMLNPSTADSSQDDPTIRRCRGFAQRWGCGALEVLNLFAWRATDPRELGEVVALRGRRHLIGPENDRAWQQALGRSPEFVVAAWGASERARNASLRHLVAPHAVHEGGASSAFGTGLLMRRLHVVGLTRSGRPRHPLYASYVATPQPWMG